MTIIEVTPEKVVFKTTIDTRGSINVPKSIRSGNIFDTGTKVKVILELVDEQPDVAITLEKCTDEMAVEGRS